MSRYRAHIAVAAYHLDGTRVARWPDGGYGVPAPYLDALRRAGARTAIVAPGEVADPDEVLDPFDGLLLCGGGDVDPARYGADPDLEHNYGVDPARDAFEIDLLRAADRAHKPVLAICRGMQVMNVAFGGTLHQHLPGMPGLLEHGVPLEGTETMHDVAPEPGTLLSATTKAPSLACSSHHHQGIDRVGDGLRVVGRSPDDLIEAIELEGADLNRETTWMLGVQWHPEETAANDTAQQRLFDALVNIGRFFGQNGRGANAGNPVEVVEPDPAWPTRFEEEEARLRTIVPPDLVARIDHVGSTSVPGLAAKPIVDVQLSVNAMSPVEAYAGPLVAAGYRHVLDPWSDDHEFFSSDGARGRAVNLHVCEADSVWERKHLAFRDHLRAHRKDAETYAAMKRELARAHGDDRASYTEGKTDFIEAIVDRALAEDRRT